MQKYATVWQHTSKLAVVFFYDTLLFQCNGVELIWSLSKCFAETNVTGGVFENMALRIEAMRTRAAYRLKIEFIWHSWSQICIGFFRITAH